MEYKVYGVVFKDNNKTYYFKSTMDFNINDEVIVETEKGLQFAKIVKFVENNEDDNYKEIIRLATEEDKDVFYKNLKDGQSASRKAQEIADKLNLDMHIINANFNFDRTQLLINFSADDRIDFRELAKKLASIYRTRIELRQIGARDKAKQIGGIGVCGHTLCCASFLNQIESISMNKAKNQGLALNPSKINGACGRLLCCLCYEDEEYTRCQKGLLSIGTVIKVNGEEGTIIGIDILKRTYKVLFGDEKRDVKAEDVFNESKK